MRCWRALTAISLAQLGLAAPAPDARRVFAVRLGQLRDTGRVNADYFHPERILAIRAMEKNRKTMRVERLRDIADFVRDAVPAETSDNYLGLANVQSNTGELVESTEEDGAGLCFRFAPQDVLFARLRPYLNKVHRAEKAGVCSTEFHVIRTHPAAKSQDEIRADYLATVLRSSLVLAQTRHMMTGNTHPRLANEDVVNLVVPIPDPKIQGIIAAEVTRRRTEARRLRAEAEADWTGARKHFEEQLIEGTQQRNKRDTWIMETLTFFAGLQALGAFLQIWQKERSATRASQTYFRVKEAALNDPEVQGKAARLNATISGHPALGRLIRNRLGRCEDKFESALRSEAEDKLNVAAQDFVRCKCLIIQTIMTAQGGVLSPDLAEEWNNLKCEVVLSR